MTEVPQVGSFRIKTPEPGLLVYEDVHDLDTGKLMKRAVEDGLYYIVRLHRDLPGLTAFIGDAVCGLKRAKEIAARLNRTAAPHELYKCRKVRQSKPTGIKKPRRKPR